MKTVVIICFITVSTLYAQMVNSLSLGGAMAIGGGSGDMLPGLTAQADVNRILYKHYGIGSHLDYSWLPAKNVYNYEFFTVGVHLFDIAPVFRAYVDLDIQRKLLFEVDPGWSFTWVYVEYSDPRGAVIKSDDLYGNFGMTYGIGMVSKFVRIMFKIKTIFFNKSGNYFEFRDNHPIHYMTLTIGLPLAG
jgi:hypothetical protein